SIASLAVAWKVGSGCRVMSASLGGDEGSPMGVSMAPSRRRGLLKSLRCAGANPSGRRSLELDRVAFRVADVEREAGPVSAVALAFLHHVHAVRPEVGADRRLVEWADLQREVVEIAPLRTGPLAAHPAERAVEGDEVDHLRAGADVGQADLRAVA